MRKLNISVATQEDVAIDFMSRVVNRRLPYLLGEIVNDAVNMCPDVSREMLVKSLIAGLADGFNHPDPDLRRIMATPPTRTVKL